MLTADVHNVWAFYKNEERSRRGFERKEALSYSVFALNVYRLY